jgi:arginyl-tRNA synthetase
MKNGQPLKMSKRAGNFVTAREVIDEVGADALRFIMLTRKNDAHFDFDLENVIEASKDNPIFYVQYAHARCSSVLRNLLEEKINFIDLNLNSGILESENSNFLHLLKDENELLIIKKIANFPRIIEMSVENFEPHRIAFYLQELAANFHSLWNKGIENPELKFIQKDNLEATKARISMVLAVKKIIKTGLDIFSIKALEKMK